MRSKRFTGSAIESLEHRSLFSYTFSITSGTVTATGNSSSDALAVQYSGGVTGLGDNVGDSASFTGVTSIIVNAGAGNDNVIIYTSVPSSITTRINGEAGNDTLGGGNGSDTLTGGDGLDNINGGAGNDGLYGDAGDDILLGGSGNDLLYGGDGNDQLRGDTGADQLRGEGDHDIVDYSNSPSAVKISLDGVANDGTYSGGSSTENDNVATSNEEITGSDYNDSIDASYVAYSVTLNGGGGNDILAGGSAKDFLDGGSGTDTVVASAGGDTIVNVP